jgi:hypothetical protein
MWTACAVLAAGCHPERFTGNSPLPVDITGQDQSYREFSMAPAEGGEEAVLFTLHRDVHHDRVRSHPFVTANDLPRDDGVAPDRSPADRDFTGLYNVRAWRADPAWLARTRPAVLGERQRPLSPADEARHPYAHRRDTAGTAGGALDEVSVCPPGLVVTGVRYRLDAESNTVAQLGALCRIPGNARRAAGSPVEGLLGGEDNHAEQKSLECPAGESVLPLAHAALGQWRHYTVVGALKLDCARFEDPERAVLHTLEVGTPKGPWLPVRCSGLDLMQPAPTVAGIRMVYGQRLDAVGLVCDVAPSVSGGPWHSTVFPVSPSMTASLGRILEPLRHAASDATLSFVGRQGTVADGTLTLPMGDGTAAVTPVSEARVLSPLDGCVLDAGAHAVLLGWGAPCGAERPVAWVELSGLEGVTVKAGDTAARGAQLGTVPALRSVRLRMVNATLCKGSLPLDPTPLSVVESPPDARALPITVRSTR